MAHLNLTFGKQKQGPVVVTPAGTREFSKVASAEESMETTTTTTESTLVEANAEVEVRTAETSKEKGKSREEVLALNVVRPMLSKTPI